MQRSTARINHIVREACSSSAKSAGLAQRGVAHLAFVRSTSASTVPLSPPTTISIWAHRRDPLLRSPHRRRYSEQVAGLACPTCREALPSSSSSSSSSSPPVLAHCPACQAFLPPSTAATEYFQLFDLPRSYAIAKPQLKRAFLEWQGRVHPDRQSASAAGDSSSASRQEDWAKMWSAIVNEGYKTLNNDRTRGEYLLSLRGVQIEEQDKMEDPELLMEILEVRESLEEAQTQEEVDAIRDSNKAMHDETLSELERALAEQDLDAPKAKAMLIRMRYQQNVEDICREWAPGKEIVLHH